MATMTFEIQSLNLCELSEITRGDGFGNVRQSSEATRMSLVIGQKPSGIFGQVRFGLCDFQSFLEVIRIFQTSPRI